MDQLPDQGNSLRRLRYGALICALFSMALLLWLIHERPEREAASYQALSEVMTRTLGRADAMVEPEMTAASSWAITAETATLLLFLLCLTNALAAIIMGLLLRRRIGPSASAGSVVALATVVAVLAISFQTGLFRW